jgi:alpha-L-fucosidase
MADTNYQISPGRKWLEAIPAPTLTASLAPGLAALVQGRRREKGGSIKRLYCHANIMHRALNHQTHRAITSILALFGIASISILQADGVPELPRPTAEQAAWQDDELGMFIHFDIEVFDKAYQYAHPRGPDRKPMGDISPSEFNPRRLDTDQWLRTARALGAKYAMFTAKHESGFLMWQSDLYPFGVKQSPWQNGRGDVVREFVNSCGKYGIQPGLYCSAGGHSYWNLHHNPVVYRHGQLSGEPEAVQAFLNMDLQMYTSLFKDAGPISYLWLDGGVDPFGDRLAPIIAKHEPNAVCFNGPSNGVPAGLARWSGNEMGYAPYPLWDTVNTTDDQLDRGAGDANGRYYVPVEANVPLRYHVWIWRADDQDKILSLSALMDMYLKTVGRGANFIINANIDPDGRIPRADARRLAEFGATIRKWFGKGIADAAGRGDVVELDLKRPRQINFVSIMEDLRPGQRVRSYAVEGRLDGQWRELCAGQSIGHKRIQQFDRSTVDAVRLRVTESVGEPIIRQLAVYNIQTLPPDPNDPAKGF